jgi:hypothetical protein
MPLGSVAAMNASLDNDYGTTRGPHAAASHELALFAGDPLDSGVEIVGNGYARVTVLPAAWLAADEGQKSTAAAVQFPNATDEWDETVTHFALFDHADHVTMWDSAPLDEPVDVTAAGAGPAVIPTIFYADTVVIP